MIRVGAIKVRGVFIILLFATVVCLVAPSYYPSIHPLEERSVRWLLSEQESPLPDRQEASLEIDRRRELALPELLRALNRQDTKFDQVYARLHSKLPARIENQLPFPTASADIRFAAIEHLRKLGPKAVQALPRLIELVRTADSSEKDHAIMGIQSIGREAIEATTCLREAIHSTNESVRLSAACALAGLDPHSPEVAPVLLAAMDDSHFDFMKWMHIANRINFKILSDSKAILDKALTTDNAQIRLLAVTLYPGKETNSRLVPIVREIMNRGFSDPELSVQALWRVDEMCISSKRALLPEISASIRHPSSEVVGRAVDVLDSMEPPDRLACLTNLLTALEHKDDNIRHSATRALAKLKGDAHAAIPALLSRIDSTLATNADNSEMETMIATETLKEIDASTPSELPGLIAALKSGSERKRLWALVCLNEMAGDRESLTREVQAATEAAEPKVRHDALSALNDPIGDPASVVNRLVELSESEDPKIRVAAFEMLGRLGPRSKNALPAMLNALDDPDSTVSAYAGWAIAELHEAGASATDRLRQMLHSANSTNQFTAMGGLAGRGRAAIPDLTEMLKSKNPRIRLSAAWLLSRIEGNPDTVRWISRVILRQETDKEAREVAIQNLQEIGDLPWGPPPRRR